jgi:O-antigen/teichoic acid export membrane protein
LVRALINAGERSARVLTLAKLASVGLSMIWGFAVTYVFVRALPAEEFRAFLLLIAFNNFTISAEFGITNVIYSRLRRYWLGAGEGIGVEQGDFRHEEIGVLFLFLTSLIVIGGAVVIGAMLLGVIRTQMPAIFLIFFFGSALNILLLLAKRALAAVDRNLLWELTDIARRLAGLAALFSVLEGLSLLASVTSLLLINVAGTLLGIVLIHRRAGMRFGHWLDWRRGGGHVKRSYLRDIGASAALTISEVAAYNSPYFMIAALTHDTRLLLIFDFTFKIIRAVATTIRATIEGALPRLTRSWFVHDTESFRRGLRRAFWVALGIAASAGMALSLFGPMIFAKLYDDRVHIMGDELLLLAVLLLALSIMCVSVYVQGALGRFAPLLRQSLPFLAGSLASVPLALAIGNPFPLSDMSFMALYMLCFLGTAALHVFAMRRLVRATPQKVAP